MKKFIRIYTTLLLIVIFLGGCAYFNMYFNAKESYKEAEKKRKETNTIDKVLYENSIKELSKILEFYPDSKWVDDALLMMGLSYLRQGENYKAQKKFTELLKKYPDSDLSDQAKVYLAETEIALKNYEEARRLISGIESENIDVEDYELTKLNAEMNLSLGDSLEALDMFIKASEESSEDAMKISFYEKTADLARAMGKYSVSSDYYKKILSLQTERPLIFETTVKYSEALSRSGDIEAAISVLENIVQDPDYVNYTLQGNVLLGRFYLEKGEKEKTVKTINDVLYNNPKDRNNGPILSEAVYYLGELFFNLEKDFEKAETMYDSSGYYDRRNEYYLKASEKLRIIRESKTLKQRTERTISEINSLENKLDSLEVVIRDSSLTEEESSKLEKEAELSKKRLKTITDSGIDDKKKLADILYFDMDLKDSARVYYRQLAEEKKHPHIASRSMLKLILSDTLRYYQLEDTLLNEYPETHAANYIREKRGLEPVTVIEDSANYYFDQASEKYLDSLYLEAVEEYTEIAARFESAKIAPEILQAAALIAEKHLNDYDRALEIYRTITDKYSQSSQARFARSKISGDAVARDKDRKDEKDVSDSDRWYLMDRRNE
jgi:TolA-binding protein